MAISLTERYRHKIKTPQELRELLGPPPRAKRVIMCHGVFDVVHPGHVRHMLYAKSKADVLVCSLTADRHITKGVHRPHVPQELIAMDHVVLFPHLGSASIHTRDAMAQLVVDNLLAWKAGKPPLTPVPETPYPPNRR